MGSAFAKLQHALWGRGHKAGASGDHVCSDLCTCPVHSIPMHYSPARDDHVCSAGGCPYRHGEHPPPWLAELISRYGEPQVYPHEGPVHMRDYGPYRREAWVWFPGGVNHNFSIAYYGWGYVLAGGHHLRPGEKRGHNATATLETAGLTGGMIRSFLKVAQLLPLQARLPTHGRPCPVKSCACPS